VTSTALSQEIPYSQALTLAGESLLSCTALSSVLPSSAGLSMAPPHLGANYGDLGLNRKSNSNVS